MGDGDDFKGCARPSKPGRGRQAGSFVRFEDIHIVRLAQHGCSPRLDACIAVCVCRIHSVDFFSNLVIMFNYVCVNMSANMVQYNCTSLLQSWFEVWVEHKF